MEKTFKPEEVREFLVTLDRNLASPFHLEVIGSTAAMLAFGLDKDTKDFDTTVSIDSITDAWDATSMETGIHIPLDKVYVQQAPYEYESRVRRLPIKGLKNIQIFVPEKHDWAIMKIARFSSKDLEHILDVAFRLSFSHEVFLERFLNEMWMSHGDRGELVYKFLMAMEEMFGPKIAGKMETAILEDKRWKS